jgi:hypothetical protein
MHLVYCVVPAFSACRVSRQQQQQHSRCDVEQLLSQHSLQAAPADVQLQAVSTEQQAEPRALVLCQSRVLELVFPPDVC